MRKQFLEVPFQTVNDVEITFEDIRSAADFWAVSMQNMICNVISLIFLYQILKYAETVFSDGFNWDYWYDPVEPIAPTDKDDRKILYENKLLGVPRIRQVIK